MLFTVLHVSIMVLLIIGIVLYVHGYMKREATDSEVRVILPFSVFLVMWGVIVCLFASGFYRDLIDWSMNPGVRALTIWDYAEYWMWGLKAILWIGTGLLLIGTSLLKIQRAHV